MRIAFWLACVTALSAQPAPDPLLARGSASIRAAIRSLPKYTCTQTVDRSSFVQTHPGLDQRGCDQIVANLDKGLARMDLVETDRLRLDVEVADAGIEIYSWPGSSRLSTERIRDLVADGPMGTGPFGPFLIDIFDNSGIRFVAEGESRIEDRPVRQYRFYVPLASSHYRVRANNETRVVRYDGRFWLDADSAELARLIVVIGELSRSTQTCQATTTVDFTEERVGSASYLMPRRSMLVILGRDAGEQSNATIYSGCREFQGESTIRYDEPVTVGAAASSEHLGAPGIPPGLPVQIALSSEIDFAQAAAGDPITGKTLQPLSEKRRTRRVLAPAGSIVHGRITHLVHHLQGKPYFAVSIVWETVETGGSRVPFGAILDRPATVLERRNLPGGGFSSIQEEARRAFPVGSTFLFPTADSKYVVPREYTASWITTVPAKGN